MRSSKETSTYMATIKKRTKEELVAAFKAATSRKREWEEEAQKEFAEMRMRSIAIG